MTDILPAIGNACSMAGFLLTLVVLLKLRRIHRSFLFQARLPDLRKKITGHRSALSKLLNNFADASAEIATEIQKCHANLQSLRPKLGRRQVVSVNALLKQTAEFGRSSVPPSKEEVRRIYLALVLLEGELENLSEDIKWRPRE